jgi:arginine/lysine/ornithine decarboxylase
MRIIGKNIREVVDWAQDSLRTSRPIAEQVIISLSESDDIIFEDGIYLLEADDEEVEKRKISSVQSTQKSFNAARKWSRIHFRNNKRNSSRQSSRNSLKSINKQAASKFSNAAEDMLQEHIAALPSSSTQEEDKR